MNFLKKDFLDALEPELVSGEYKARYLEELGDHFDDEQYNLSVSGAKEPEKAVVKNMGNGHELAKDFNKTIMQINNKYLWIDYIQFALISLFIMPPIGWAIMMVLNYIRELSTEINFIDFALPIIIFLLGIPTLFILGGAKLFYLLSQKETFKKTASLIILISISVISLCYFLFCIILFTSSGNSHLNELPGYIITFLIADLLIASYSMICLILIKKIINSWQKKIIIKKNKSFSCLKTKRIFLYYLCWLSVI